MNHLKNKLARGELALGLVHFAAGCPATIEVMARAGLDWVTIDTEHACNSVSDLQNLIRTAELLWHYANHPPYGSQLPHHSAGS